MICINVIYGILEFQDHIPSLEDLFHVSDLVVCAIKEIIPEKHGHKKIRLSLKLEDINNGLSTISKGMVCVTFNMNS